MCGEWKEVKGHITCVSNKLCSVVDYGVVGVENSDSTITC